MKSERVTTTSNVAELDSTIGADKAHSQGEGHKVAIYDQRASTQTMDTLRHMYGNMSRSDIELLEELSGRRSVLAGVYEGLYGMSTKHLFRIRYNTNRTTILCLQVPKLSFLRPAHCRPPVWCFRTKRGCLKSPSCRIGSFSGVKIERARTLWKLTRVS